MVTRTQPIDRLEVENVLIRVLWNRRNHKPAYALSDLKKQGSDSADAGTEPPGRQTRVLEKRATSKIP
ncbi:hypothetical protein PTT_14971 [Pyrenophora teres f. teres 0-1]|uniref:Uncharacterized protein n=1 Tax=Pyrenophora teres f. teres (strain 0-1) TaxID=861557 RepID=E3RZB6_PYRTT|nr:hypothetical protein PTT_14971 [Pyrenophora teres f. teres 0-1]